MPRGSLQPLSARRRWPLFLLVQLVVALLLLEAVLRVGGSRLGMASLLYLPGASSHYDVAHSLEDLMGRSIIGFSPYQDFYGFVLNSRSMRTKEYGEHPAAGTERVLVFGDSFTFASGGLPHAAHWPTILEAELSSSRPVEVLRLGVPGTGPRFQLRLWQIEGSRLHADTVVHAFFIGNDFFDQLGRPTLSAVIRQRPGDLLARHWLTYRAVRNLRRVARGAERSAARDADQTPRGGTGGYELPGYASRWDPTRPTFSRDEFLAIEARRLALCRREDSELFERVLDEVGTTLLAFEESVRGAGARYVVMLIPDEFQVSPKVLADVLDATGTTIESYDLYRPQRRLAQWLTRRQVEVLDLLPFFVAAGRSGALYNPRDTHWNEDGNRLAARLLAAHLDGKELDGDVPARGLLFADGLDDGGTGAWLSGGG